MIDLTIIDGVAQINTYTGNIEVIEIVDDDFIHVKIGSNVIGITVKDTTINGETFTTVESFTNKINELTTE